jgi:hypothetical protein
MRLYPRRLVILCAALALNLAVPGSAAAQEPVRPVLQPTTAGRVHRLTLKDGSQLIGRIVSVDSASVQFESALGSTTIAIDAIASAKEETPGQTRQGKYYFRNPNATRLIFAPTGRMLAQGEGYFSDFWIFFPGIAAGVTNRITLGGGMSIFPAVGVEDQLYFVTPKIGIVQGDRFNAAVGALALAVPDFDNGRESAGLLYGVGTWGSPDQSFTAGLGYGYLGGTLSRDAIVMLGGEARAAPRLSFVTENYFFPGGGLISGGIRFMSQDITVDLALARPVSTDEQFTFPLLGFMWKW